MFNRIRNKIGAAHVLGVIAIVLALSGTSIALPGKNSVDTGDIRNGTITGADVRKNALNGNQIAEQKLSAVRLATSAIEARNVLWAVVKNPNGAKNAAIIRAGQASTVAGEGNDLTNVAFGRDVTNCAWTATSQGGGYAQTTATPGVAGSVTVRTRNAAGNLEDEPFTVQVVC